MVYAPNTDKFDQKFVQRVQRLVRGYKGPYQATNLVNGLLGLLIVAGNAFVKRVPEVPADSLRGWGVNSDTIRRWGRTFNGTKRRSLRHLVKALRSSVTQLGLTLHHRNGKYVGFEFTDRSGFHAYFRASEMRRFVSKLTECVDTYGALGPNTRFIASLRRDAFHRRSCRWARKISRTNVLGVKTRQAAIRAGHRPCRVCRP
jgi:hypothetical protein